MALSETNELKVCLILGIPLPVLSEQLALMTLSSTAQTLIEAQILLWDTAGYNYTDIEPNLKNFGARISASKAERKIQERIAVLLERTDWGSGSSSFLQRS